MGKHFSNLLERDLRWEGYGLTYRQSDCQQFIEADTDRP
jgi:hypothetical protein